MRYAKGIAGADINITGPRKLGAALQVAKGLEGCFGFSGFSICGIAFHGEMAAEMYWQTCFCRFVLECGAGFVWLAARYY
nr:hypothetical protein [uncultured Desulfobacter sp.]